MGTHSELFAGRMSVRRRTIRAFACAVAVLLIATVSRADYLVASRDGLLKDAASSSGTMIFRVKAGDVLRLIETTQSAGYYHAQPAAGGAAGWIYRTYVRRYPGAPEEGGTGVVVPSPSAPVATGPLSDASSFPIPNCPPEGDAVKESVKATNPLKNRVHAPAAPQVQTLSLEALLAEGDDHDRWNSGMAIDLTGYVYDVKPGGKETCNCHAPDPTNRDTHIELTRNPQDTGETRRVIVEVTPEWRKLMATAGKDWSTSGLQGSILHHYVRVRGWMFYDAEHEHQSENTEPDGDSNWRATAWEVHPITSLEVVQNP